MGSEYQEVKGSLNVKYELTVQILHCRNVEFTLPYFQIEIVSGHSSIQLGLVTGKNSKLLLSKNDEATDEP